ncbi:protein farnesyltransferase subunit beta-like [Chenopodium quinoa]|uniref:protein farnesyltransferase subunit beta-like n=1 Tax=Chenopodium quinoa TaxID=63459 RepID=UPI000B779FEE|nr:protein farnesyltransferase subunit beta-like [Chenopodium quinoa]
MDAAPEANVTVTMREQGMVESKVFSIYQHFNDLPRRAQTVMMEIASDKHAEYLTNGLKWLPASFCVLDANRPWLCYWILHSLALLGESFDDNLEHDVVAFLSQCQDPHGGYGGGPGQMPHLATTYASVNSLITLGGRSALSSIDRDRLYAFLQRMKDPGGSFRMHEKGEIDVRACYTAISVASILNILDHELVQNVGDYIMSCQTYEGGIAGEPGSEAHGGYTFCGLATMILINEVHRLDLPALINWVVFRQGVEGGFQGRTNKLVDGCYSFWQGGIFPLIQRLLQIIEKQLGMMSNGSSKRNLNLPEEICQMDSSHIGLKSLQDVPDVANLSDIGFEFVKRSVNIGPLFHNFALQQYIILCSQIMDGGFRDKPGKSRDFYHTCYCLSGLSVCQYISLKDADSLRTAQEVLGPYSNLLEPIHPLYNVVLDRYYNVQEFFSQL